MAGSERYVVNNSKITHQTIDGEVVIVNLASGNYHSLQGSAAAVWGILERGGEFSAIVDWLGKHCKGSASEIGHGLNSFLEKLQQEGLISPSAEGSLQAADGSRPQSSDVVSGPGAGEFDLPVLSTYTDMQDLLMLDPIHDVDESGWPMKPDPPKEDSSPQNPDFKQ